VKYFAYELPPFGDVSPKTTAVLVLYLVPVMVIVGDVMYPEP
jgi:hypothetical protein